MIHFLHKRDSKVLCHFCPYVVNQSVIVLHKILLELLWPRLAEQWKLLVPILHCENHKDFDWEAIDHPHTIRLTDFLFGMKESGGAGIACVRGVEEERRKKKNNRFLLAFFLPFFKFVKKTILPFKIWSNIC